MDEILRFLADHMSFLWRGGRYRISDSGAGGGFGNAWVYVQSDAARLHVVRDRGLLSLSVQPSFVSTEQNWYDWCQLDMLRQMRLTSRASSGVTNESLAVFVEENLDWIEDQMSESNWPSTRREIERLAALRTRDHDTSVGLR